MKKISVAILTLCFVTGPILAQMDFAEHLFKQGEFYRAITEYKRYIFLNPQNKKENALCLYRIGESYLKGEKWFDAADNFKKLVSEYPDSELVLKARYMTGVSYYRAGARSIAIPHFEKIIEESPNAEYSAKARFFIALARAEDMDWEKSKKEFEVLAATHPKSPLAPKSLKLFSMANDAENLPAKSPVFSGTLSAILPGAGQFYSERYRDALSAFLYNGILGYLTYDAHTKDSNSVYVFGTLTGLFYLSNIYGAINSAQNANLLIRVNHLNKLRKEARVELLFKF